MAETRQIAGILLLALLPAWPAAGQITISPAVQQESEIVTDRPDVTESSVVVPVSSLQLENGFTWTADRKTESVDFSQTLIRIGFLDKTEIRLVVPDYIHGFDSSHLQSGFEDFAIGMKRQLGPLPGGLDLSVIIAMSLPSGTHELSTRGYDPFIKLPWSKDLEHGWFVGGMQSLFWNTDGGKRNGVWEATFYLEKEISKRLDAFAEYAGDFAQHGGSKHLAHFGAAFRFHNTSQLDFHFGFGVNRESPDHLIGIGYSVRFDNLWK